MSHADEQNPFFILLTGHAHPRAFSVEVDAAKVKMHFSKDSKKLKWQLKIRTFMLIMERNESVTSGRTLMTWCLVRSSKDGS